MESVMRIVGRKSFIIAVMKLVWFVLTVAFAFGFGTIYMGLSVRMRILLAVSGLSIVAGYLYMVIGCRYNNRWATFFGYIVTAAGAILIELGVLFIGG